MKKFYSTLIFFICLINVSRAQHIGYVITQKNDTINCAKVTNSNSSLKYKVAAKDNFIKIKIENIKEFQLTSDSTIYRSELLSDTTPPKFFQLFLRGKICIYTDYAYGPNYNPGIWYASKNNGKLQCVKIKGVSFIGGSRKERKALLLDMFSDDLKIYNKYNADETLSSEGIINYVKQYNQDNP